MAWDGCKFPPRDWQAKALPVIIDGCKRGIPGIVSAIMGSGKSILQAELVHEAIPKLAGRTIVVSAPTRKLVRQLGATVAQRCGQERVGLYYSDTKEIRPITVCCGDSLPSLVAALDGRKVALAVVDEAHGSEATHLKPAILALRASALVGFTATPFRSLPKESVTLFQTIFVRYTMRDALRDGVLVPMRHERYIGHDPDHLDSECVEMIRKYGDGPGIVSATTIEDCEAYARLLCDQGIQAAPIHSLLDESRQEHLLEGLRRGQWRCLVHVSLLAEGVDLPWLRWICLRRKVGASVRFFQELGRVLRTHPGKREGVVMDPHLLLGRFGLTTAESIGDALDEAANLEADREQARRALADLEVVALDRLTAYLEEVREAMQKVGLTREPHEPGAAWRIADISSKQVALIEKVRGSTRHIPEVYRAPIRALARHPWSLTRGQASDLADVLIGSSEFARKRAESSKRPAYMIQWSPSALPTLDVPNHESAIVEKMKGAKSA